MDHKDEEMEGKISENSRLEMEKKRQEIFEVKLREITNSQEGQDIIRRLAKNINNCEILAKQNDNELKHLRYSENGNHITADIYDRNCIVVDTHKEIHRDMARVADILGVTVPAILAVGGTGNK